MLGFFERRRHAEGPTQARTATARSARVAIRVAFGEVNETSRATRPTSSRETPGQRAPGVARFNASIRKGLRQRAHQAERPESAFPARPGTGSPRRASFRPPRSRFLSLTAHRRVNGEAATDNLVCHWVTCSKGSGGRPQAKALHDWLERQPEPGLDCSSRASNGDSPALVKASVRAENKPRMGVQQIGGGWMQSVVTSEAGLR